MVGPYIGRWRLVRSRVTVTAGPAQDTHLLRLRRIADSSHHSSLDQTLVTMTVGRYKKTFSIHKHVLSSHSDYFRQSFEYGQYQFDFPDVDSHIFTLFQWWLYAQASRSNESDAPSNGSLTYEQALGMMNGRELISQNNTRTPAHDQRNAIAKLITGLSQLQGLEKLRQKTLPSWVYNKGRIPE